MTSLREDVLIDLFQISNHFAHCTQLNAFSISKIVLCLLVISLNID